MVDSQANCNIRKSSGFPSSNEHFKGEQVNSNKVSYIVQSVGKCFNMHRQWLIQGVLNFVLYHGEDCNRGPKNDPPILEPAFLLVNR